MKKLLLITFLLISFGSFSQTIDRKWNIGLHGGAMQYSGDLGKGFYKTDQSLYGFGGISISRYLANILDLNLMVTKGEVGFVSPGKYYHDVVNTATLNLRFNLIGPESFVRPYIFAGGGALFFDKNTSINKSSTNFAVPSFGGGINFKLGPYVMLQVQEHFLFSDHDNRDSVVAGGNDLYLMHTVGLTFNLGKKKDADKDGVADRIDKCPDTPPGVAVDATGCPLDKDKDGVADYQDECPDVAGVKDLKGCPDKDLDGIADKDDRCPEVSGTLAMRGCPDTDGDGVPDIDDKCAGTKAGYKVDSTGCTLDNDKDGIVNEEDKCPDAAGIASLEGCPDTDGDGVADNVDRCPQEKGSIANNGCPEMAKEDVKRITQIASKIFFETNSDKLKVASLVQLDDLATILQKYPEAKLAIEGHTDDVGEDAYNLTLSQKRTNSVKAYLMSKGLAEERLTATGYGETQPIADNKTSTGRAKNRRVELKTSY